MTKTLKLGLFLVLSLCVSGTWAAWDDPPLVNSVMGTSTSFGLNFTANGSHQQIAIFVVNSNDGTGFHVDFTFRNKGNFVSGTRQIPMTNVVLRKLSGTFGSSGTFEEPVTDVSIPVDPVTGIATWSPGAGPPGGATVNFVVAIYVDWVGSSSRMAGFYTEGITATIVSGP